MGRLYRFAYSMQNLDFPLPGSPYKTTGVLDLPGEK